MHKSCIFDYVIINDKNHIGSYVYLIKHLWSRINQYPWSTINQPSILNWINALVDTWLTLNQHLGQQLINSQLIFADMPSSVDRYMSQSTWPTIDQVSTECWLSINWDVDQVSIVMLILCWWRVTIDTWTQISLEHMILNKC